MKCCSAYPWIATATGGPTWHSSPTSAGPRTDPCPSSDNAWDVAPDLAVEVVSPTDLAEELMDKVAEYFQAGVRLVWVVYPRLRLIHVYESLTQVRGLTAADELDGGAVLPGFRTPVAALFPEAAPPV